MIFERSFPNGSESPRLARRFVTSVLEHLDAETIAEIELMVSEVATNAIHHARSGFEVRIVEGPDEVCVEVTDRGDGTPRARRPTPNEPTGRGLVIVDTLADEWAVERVADGTTVRFCKALARQPT